MNWNYPLSVNIDGEEYKIKNQCDYRNVLNIMVLYEDANFSLETKTQVAFEMFYENYKSIKNKQKAVLEMIRVLNGLREDEVERVSNSKEPEKPRIMSWKQDFSLIAPEISKTLGYNIQEPGRYTHWWSFTSAYMAINSECAWSTFLSIRKKRIYGKKLEKWEEEIYRDNRKRIDLEIPLTDEEKEWLEGDD